MSAPVAFDPQPLVEPVDHRAVGEFARRTGVSAFSFGRNPAGIIVLVIFAVIFIPVVLTITGTLVTVAFSAIGSGRGLSVAALLPVLVIVAVVVIVTVIAVRAWRGTRIRAYRLDRFARANGMSYRPRHANPPLPGMIFGLGSAREATDLVRGDRPRFVEFANYRYTTGSGKNKSTHRWGYVAVRLDVPLPHIVLDATSNNGLFGSNLPLTLDKDQRLSLEGDFDQHFTLYCPRGYERDALYLFTPDIMARFIDNAAALDVEIVDDWLFLYAKRDFSTLDPATWAWLFSVVRALLDKLAQWARWRDERLAASAAPIVGVDAGGASTAPAMPFVAPATLLRPPPGVAAPGRRLRKGVPWAAIIVFAVFGLFWLFSQLGGLSLFLGR